MNKAKELARQHWGYVGMITERMYLDAFEHGYKHGVEDAAKSSQVPKRGPTIDEQVKGYTHVPSCDGWTSNVAFPEAVSSNDADAEATGFASRQEDIQKAWQTREDNQK